MSLPVLNNASPCVAHGCALCCYDTEMPLLEEDVARLEKLGHPRGAFTRVGADDVLYLATVEPAEGMPGRPCYFLKENRCSAYADRPTGCRIYPFVMTDDGKRVLRDDDCPHNREFPGDPSLKRRIQKIAAQLAREAARR